MSLWASETAVSTVGPLIKVMTEPSCKPVALSQYRGKVVALIFILTTCPHCQKTIGLLAKQQNEFGPSGLQVVASAVDTTAALAVPNFIKTFNPPFPVGYNTDSNAVLDYLQHPRMVVPYMPLLVFIDRQGVIRAQYEGHDPFMDEASQEANLRAKITELLKAGEPPRKTPAAKKRG